jgi:epsilon-lactone hydrolase
MTTLRQISAVLPPERAWSRWLSRQIVSGIMDAFGPRLAGTRTEPIDVHHDGRRVVGEWVRAPGARTGAGAIYFVHGSGFALCSPRTHRRLTSWLSRLTGLPVFAVDYRLAPRHRFPTAANDVRAGWDWLTSQVPPDRVVIAGDSAGGHLSVDLLLQPDVAANGPAALALFSPLIDLTLELARAREDLRRDPAAETRRRRRTVVAPDTHPGRRRRNAAGRCAAPGRRHPRRRWPLHFADLAGPVTRVPGAAQAVAGSRQGHEARRTFHRHLDARQRY